MPSLVLIIMWAAAGAVTAMLVEAAIVALPRQASFIATLRARLQGHRTVWDWLPVIAFLRTWRRPSIPRREALRRLLVEAVLIAVFAWLAWRYGVTWRMFILSIYAALFVTVIGIDVEHHLILNLVLAPAAIFALLVSPTLAEVGLANALWGAIVGFVIMLLPALLMPRGLGAGDVKLAGFLGLATGFPGIVMALAGGIVLGGIITLALLVTRRIGRHDYVPYGPFLIGGAVLVLLAW